MDEIKISEEFDGVFRFSNNSDEDFLALWNNKEYTFPKNTRSPMIIPNESLENIQEIRKKWAYKWAQREWFKSPQYNRMKEMGNGLPPTMQEKDLESLIQMCLEPLPLSKATVKEGKSQDVKTRATKAISDGSNPQFPVADDLNETFKDEPVSSIGAQSTKFST